VLVATKPVDFRKGIDGLAALAQEQLRPDPYTGQSSSSAPSAAKLDPLLAMIQSWFATSNHN